MFDYMIPCTVEHGFSLSNKFFTILDNTNAENKCNEMIFYLAWLVSQDVFEEASFFCMMVGHTYTDLDQSFNTMMMHLKQFAIYTVSVLVNRIWSALRKYDCWEVRDVHALWDWKEYFNGHVCERLRGFCTSQHGEGMHEFLLRKDRDGVVRMVCRKSSKASSFFPEGDGYQVFDTIPSGEPPLAQYVKSEVEWQRHAFEGSLRKWYRFMVVGGQSEMGSIRDEWEDVFAQLPSDGDVNSIGANKKPKWIELPKRRPQVQSANLPFGSTVLAGMTSRLENPPINPVVGRGRTQAEVDREVAAYRAWQRRENAESAFPCVFLGDYLFIRLPSKPLMLVRVVNDCCIGDASAPTLSFTAGSHMSCRSAIYCMHTL